MKFKFFYDKSFNLSFFGLEKLHPFQADRAGKIRKLLLKSKYFQKSDFIKPQLEEALIPFHLDPEYLNKLNDPDFLGTCLELPFIKHMPRRFIKSRLLDPMNLGVNATLQATHLALKENIIAVNLFGGFHHASFNSGGGFCIYPDVPIAMKELRQAGLCQHIALIDCDGHQGNGTERSIDKQDEFTLMIDMYDAMVYPQDAQAAENIHVNIGLGPIEDEQYLEAMDKYVIPALDNFKPDIIFYFAGSDPYKDDPLTYLNLTENGLNQRDAKIMDYATKHNIALVILLAGGYSKQAAAIMANSFINFAK